MTAYNNPITGNGTIDVGSAPSGQVFTQFGVTVSGPRGPWSDVSQSFAVDLQYSEDGTNWETTDSHQHAGSGRTLMGGKYLTAAQLRLVVSGFPSGAPAHMARTFAHIMKKPFTSVAGSINAAPSDAAYDWTMMGMSFGVATTAMTVFGHGDATGTANTTLDVPGNGTGSLLANVPRMLIIACDQGANWTITDTKGNSYSQQGAIGSPTSCLFLQFPDNTADLTASDVIHIVADRPLKMMAAAFQLAGSTGYQNTTVNDGNGVSANVQNPTGANVDYVSLIASSAFLPNDPAGYANAIALSGSGLFFTASLGKNAA